MKLSVKLKCGYSVQHYLLAIDDVMLTQVFCAQLASERNNLILTDESSISA